MSEVCVLLAQTSILQKAMLLINVKENDLDFVIFTYNCCESRLLTFVFDTKWYLKVGSVCIYLNVTLLFLSLPSHPR